MAGTSWGTVAYHWDTSTWNRRPLVLPAHGPGTPGSHFQFALLDELLIGTQPTGEVLLWDFGKAEQPDPQVLLTLEQKTIHAIAFHPGGDLFAVGSSDGSIYLLSLLDPKDSSPLLQFSTRGSPTTSLAFRSDGNVLAVSFADGSIELIGEQTLRSVEPPKQRLSLIQRHVPTSHLQIKSVRKN